MTKSVNLHSPQQQSTVRVPESTALFGLESGTKVAVTRDLLSVSTTMARSS